MVDSSSNEVLGGLSLWYSRSVPPLFCAATGVAASTAIQKSAMDAASNLPGSRLVRRLASHKVFIFYRIAAGRAQRGASILATSIVRRLAGLRHLAGLREFLSCHGLRHLAQFRRSLGIAARRAASEPQEGAPRMPRDPSPPAVH